MRSNDAMNFGMILRVQAIDGIDNGINLYDTDKLPRYANDTHLSARVGRLNPDWMDEQTSEAEDEAFRKAMSLTGGEFLEVSCMDSVNGLDATYLKAALSRGSQFSC